MKIVSVDNILGTATVQIWDLPEKSLRRRTLIKGYTLSKTTLKDGLLRQDLFALGKSWTDVRSVPDGTLVNIPSGPDVI
jgi:hypothetical protein